MGNSFVEKMAPLYQQAKKETGSPMLVSILLAQAVLESGYGQSELARMANNFAGIKASPPWDGPVYAVESPEDDGHGNVTKRRSLFAKFDSVHDFVRYHTNFCQNNSVRRKHYAKVLAAKTAEEQAKYLQGTYATDTRYTAKLMSRIRDLDLKQYDEKGNDKMSYTIEKQLRHDTPQVGVAPYRQVHAHSTGNKRSNENGEAAYMARKDLDSGFYTHVVGNGRVIQVSRTNAGAWDVGGGWNAETYAAVELIESHKTQVEFDRDYALYVQLLRDLADEAGIPKTLDTGELAGIKTHNYCTYHQPGNRSDHVDPLPYLKSWGISAAQFKRDIESGVAGSPAPKPSGQQPTAPASNSDVKWESWTGRVTVDVLNVRNAPNTDGAVAAQYSRGETINFDGWLWANGYRWGTYKSRSGVRRYVAYGEIGGASYMSW